MERVTKQRDKDTKIACYGTYSMIPHGIIQNLPALRQLLKDGQIYSPERRKNSEGCLMASAAYATSAFFANPIVFDSRTQNGRKAFNAHARD